MAEIRRLTVEFSKEGNQAEGFVNEYIYF